MQNFNPTVTTCSSCGQMLPHDALICPKCGGFVHRQQLEQLAAEATRLEQSHPAQAAQYWQQCLPLLPPNSPQYQNIAQRIAHLTHMASNGQTAAPEPTGERKLYPHAPRKNDSAPLAIAKTVGSMAISAAVYAIFFHGAFEPPSWPLAIGFAIGFVILMLVHEMGHVFALWYYGLSASPPIFIPFIGALINLRESPPNALAEAVVGMGGPFLGTIGSLACLALAFCLPQYPVLMLVAYFGMILNLFNLLPVPPLDGGRITAALSPWLWILGLAILAVVFFYDWSRGAHAYILLAVVFIAWPRIRRTLQMRHRDLPYYQVPLAGSCTIGAIYVLLALLLFGLKIYLHSRVGDTFL